MIEPDTHNTAGAEAKIEISLSRLGQLFDPFDPHLFTSAIYDQAAEEYIIGSVERDATPQAAMSGGPFDSGSAAGPLRIMARQSITTLPTMQKVSGAGCACYFATVVSF